MLDVFWMCLGSCVGFPVVIALIALITAPLERRRLRRAEERFLAGRSPMTDDEFLRRAGAGPDDETFFRTARQVMAELSGISPAMVHPEDTVRSLLNLQWDCGFIEDFVFDLEDRTMSELPGGYPPESQTLGAYVTELGAKRKPAVARGL